MANKDGAANIIPNSGGTHLLKVFSLKYVSDLEGFNDGNKDDYFVYDIGYITRL